MILVVAACGGEREGPPSCPLVPCITGAASLVWTPPRRTRWAGYDLAVHGELLYVGAPGETTEAAHWDPRVLAIELPSLHTLGSWFDKTPADGTGYPVSAADLDGDGAPEVAVGAFNKDAAGATYLLSGAPSEDLSISVQALLTFSAPTFTRVGLRTGFADLVEGDGVELLTSGSGMIYDWPGAVYLLDPTLRGELGEDDATVIVRGPPGLGEDSLAWDADGDGGPDLVTSLPAQAGVGLIPGPLAPGEYGEDAVVGAWTGRPESPSDCLGDTLEPAGDVTGDGQPDLLVAAPNYTGTDVREGRAYVVPAGDLRFGPADDLPIQVHGSGLGSAMGYGLTSGDVDGDGQHDMLVAAPGVYPGALPGTLFAFRGPVEGVLTPPDAIAFLHGEHDFDQLGRAIVTLDADGDAQDDVIVSAIGLDEGKGGVYLVPGIALVP